MRVQLNRVEMHEGSVAQGLSYTRVQLCLGLDARGFGYMASVAWVQPSTKLQRRYLDFCRREIK
jgi:hypothetical protein